MYKKTKNKKDRKVILCISPVHTIKENLWDNVFEQILNSISKFKAYELKSEKQDALNKSCSKIYFIVLNDLDSEKRVSKIISSFNFEIVPY